jgi:PAT family beta-lactamase induction signal transducer AmpG
MGATLADHAGLRLGTLSALYFAQGVPWGFISIGYGVLLADLGLGAAEIGAAMGLAYLPWSFKILWGPLLDAVPKLRVGRRRPFIVFAELMMGLSLLGLLVVDPRTDLGMVAAILFVNNTFAAMQDVAVDALAIDILPDEEKGRANSLMWAGKSLGVVAGGSGGLIVAKNMGWNALFVMMAVLLWLIMLLPLLLRERPVEDDDQPVDASLLKLGIFLFPFAAVGAAMYGMGMLEERLAEAEHWGASFVSVAQPFVAVFGALLAWPVVDRRGFAELADSFRTPTPWWALLAAVVTPIGYAMVGPATTKLTRVDLGLSEESLSILALADSFAGIVGALVGGLVAHRLGLRPGMATTMVGIGAVLALWAGTEAHWGVWLWLLAFTALLGMAINAYQAANLGLFMQVSNPRVGATHFAIYMAATNLTYSFTAPLGGIIADRMGFVALFGIGAVLQVLAVVLLLPIDAERAKAHFAHLD